MGGATERGTRRGGLVDRRAVAERLAARARPLSTTSDQVTSPIHWPSVDGCCRTHGLSDLAYVARAVIDGLCEFPRLNATTGASGLDVASAVNLGIAVETERGVVVPVVHRAELLEPEALAARMLELAGSARAGTLVGGDLDDGTFTITDVGSLGESPAIRPPQVATLSVDGRRAGHLALTFDPTVIDESYGTTFLARLRTVLEEGER